VTDILFLSKLTKRTLLYLSI